MFRGGPAFHISKGFGMARLGAVFSVCLIGSFGLAFDAVRANSIADAMNGVLGLPWLAVGVVVPAPSGLVIFGGLRKIAPVAGIVAPFMALACIAVALFVVIVSIETAPGVMIHSAASAFGMEQTAGGVAGGVAAASPSCAASCWRWWSGAPVRASRRCSMRRTRPWG